MSLTAGEVARKVVHMGVGSIAFALRALGPFWSAVCAATAVAFNFLVLPRVGGKALWRTAERERGASVGIILYPLSVLILILMFYRRLEVAAAIWGIMAFGDGMASLVGMAIGRHKLPWNPRKSWAGSLAFFAFGAAGATTLLMWTAPGRYELAFALGVCSATALIAAGLESIPQGLDDNIGVPILSGLVLYGLLLGEGGYTVLASPDFLGRLALGAAVNLVVAGLGFAARSVDKSGMAVGFLLGTVVWACLGWQGYLLLLAFFVIGTGLTKLGYERKAAEDLAQEGGGRRSARHAIANTGVAAACAFLALVTQHWELFAIAFAGAFATASADTAGSEVGQLYGKRAILATTFRPVPRGTQGAVSVEGTVAGIVAATVVASLGAGVGLYRPVAIGVVVLAAFLGSWLESVVGATIERAGWLDNEAVNFLNTLIGALLALGLAAFLIL